MSSNRRFAAAFGFLAGLPAYAAPPAPLPAAPAAAVLNEVLYDPDGPDTGFEYVELASPPGADPGGSLAGWVLETGNGASPDDWTLAWTGGPEDRLQGGLFLIGEDVVEPRPDAVHDLDLQNGPDACRLRGPGGFMDILGWGEPLDASYAEEPPAPDVASGQALARLPDGADTDCNSCDWRAAPPTPGEPNAPAVAVMVVDAVTPPSDLTPGAAFEFAWTLRNVGRSPWNERVSVRCAVHPGETLAEFAPFAAGALAPGAVSRVARTIAPPPGAHRPVSDPPFPVDTEPWRGAGEDLAICEVFARPADDGPEWIELQHRGAAALDLAELRVEDASGTSARLHGVIAPGGFVVVTADTTSLRARWLIPQETALVQAASWPALNHTATAGAAAETLRLTLGELALESAAIPGGIDEDISWERVSLLRAGADLANWQTSLDAGGATPGRVNSRDGDRALEHAPAAGSVLAAPSTFHPERDGPALLVFSTRAASSRCVMDLFDSSGVLVQRLQSWASGPHEHRAFWDGRDAAGGRAPLGLYIVRAEADGEPAARATIVLLQ